MAFRDTEAALVAERDALRARLEEREQELAEAREATRQALASKGPTTARGGLRRVPAVAGTLGVLVIATAGWFAGQPAPAAPEPAGPSWEDLPGRVVGVEGTVLASDGYPPPGTPCTLKVATGPFPPHGTVTCDRWSSARMAARDALCECVEDACSCVGEAGIVRYERRRDRGLAVACQDGSCVVMSLRGLRGILDVSPLPEAGQVTPGDLDAVASLASSAVRSCAVDVRGVAMCWSAFDGSPHSLPPGLAPVAQLALHAGHSCAVDFDGNVACWGDDDFRQASPPRNLPRAVHVVVGARHTCVSLQDGTVTCWGDNTRGQTDVPAGLAGVRALTAGFVHTCAIAGDGRVVCWGADGEWDVPPGLTSAVAIDAAENRTCAVDDRQRVLCWNFRSSEPLAQPADVPPATHVATGESSVCVWVERGSLFCWGGEVEVPGDLGPVSSVEVGTQQTCAVVADGGVRCWGNSPSLFQGPSWSGPAQRGRADLDAGP